MVVVTRGPIHIMALIEETRPMQISAPTMRPPRSPKMCLPATTATSIWPASCVDRRGVEKEGIERDVEDDDDRRPGQERARQAALRVVHFADDIGRGIPA